MKNRINKSNWGCRLVAFYDIIRVLQMSRLPGCMVEQQSVFCSAARPERSSL